MSRKFHLVKAMVFPVVIYGCENWTVKKAEHQRKDAFELCCWRRLLRVLWTARRSNQSILKEISPGCSFGRTDVEAETPILWSPHVKSWLIGKDWCWEGLGAGGEGDDRGWDGWMGSLTRWTWVCIDSRSWWWTGRPGMLWFMGSQGVGHDWSTELNWMKILQYVLYFCNFHTYCSYFPALTFTNFTALRFWYFTHLEYALLSIWY